MAGSPPAIEFGPAVEIGRGFPSSSPAGMAILLGRGEQGDNRRGVLPSVLVATLGAYKPMTNKTFGR